MIKLVQNESEKIQKNHQESRRKTRGGKNGKNNPRARVARKIIGKFKVFSISYKNYVTLPTIEIRSYPAQFT